MKAAMKNAKAGGLILARNPGLAMFGILALALAIGANTSVFNIVNAMTLVTPRCSQSPDRLVTVLTNHPVSAVDGYDGRCSGSEIVESQYQSSPEETGVQSSAPAAETCPDRVQLVAGNDGSLALRSEFHRNRSVRAHRGHSRSANLAAAAQGRLRSPASVSNASSTQTTEASVGSPTGDQEPATVRPQPNNRAEVSDCVVRRSKS